MDEPREILLGAYRDFNARRMEAVIARMAPDVVWSNGQDGGFVYGHEGVRNYWTRQWGMLDPNVEPVTIEEDDRGRHVVVVHQVVHDLAGNLLADTTVRHAYVMRNELIERMDIE